MSLWNFWNSLFGNSVQLFTASTIKELANDPDAMDALNKIKSASQNIFSRSYNSNRQ